MWISDVILQRSSLGTPMNRHRKTSYSRLPLAITLVIAAFVSTFFIAIFSNKGMDYWMIKNPVSPGHTLSANDVEIVHANLSGASDIYLDKSIDPIGMVTTRLINAHEIIAKTDLASASDAMSTSAVPVSVRSSDFAGGISIGESVDLYWVLDTENGQDAMDPILILGGVTLLSYDKAGNNFSGEVGLTIAVEETQVLRVLSATTQGRLVVVRSHV